jgi:hypothetical protein
MKRILWVLLFSLGGSILLIAWPEKGQKSDVDLSTIRTVTGTVASVTISAGRRRQKFILDCGGGKSLILYLGSYRYLSSKKFVLAVGDKVSAKVANKCPGKDADEVIALEVTDLTTGAHILIRDGEGVPVWSKESRERSKGSNP